MHNATENIALVFLHEWITTPTLFSLLSIIQRWCRLQEPQSTDDPVSEMRIVSSLMVQEVYSERTINSSSTEDGFCL